ncbi:esterase-like activity of phytase family protein, partial [Phenylobacterium sp.]|uniref:esterase-like activity of phytase family protein n=1 Tax=Phenylobacterium sp. TaxID=1871053 RepID=UPI0035263885
LGCALALSALAACAPTATAPLPPTPVAAGPAISIKSEPAFLDSAAPGPMKIGRFTFVGGLQLTSADTARLHGLSDIRVTVDGHTTIVSDEGDLLQGRLVLDAQGKPVSIADARLTGLLGLDGAPLQGKEQSDSEGLALLADGSRLISFELNDRIWRYPAGDGLPTRAPSPEATFPRNAGMEALAEDPANGPDAYLVGGEDGGEVWRCRLSGACASAHVIEKPAEFGLVAAAPLPAGRWAFMLRAYDPIRGVRIVITIRDAAWAEVDRLELARPLNLDNFEGLAAVPAADGIVRLYLISDDNFSNAQRTYLFAFDWTAKN